MTNNSKIALVTGGSRGLGKDMAMQLATKGLDVIITYNSKKDEANEVVATIEAMGRKSVALQLDVSDYAQYEPFFTEKLTSALQSTFGTDKIDYLVNNAGYGIYKTFQETTINDFKDMVNVHLMAAFFITQNAVKYMNDGGGVVNISTGLARFSMPGYAAYAAMKGATETLSKYQALELGSRKIRVNIVAPGAIETDFGGGAVRDNEGLNKMLANQTALGRVGLPDDIGSVVAFLCTDDAKWVNAQRIEVSGGIHL